MADWRHFGEAGDPTEDGRCRWCGAKLRQRMRRAVSTAEAHQLAIRDEPIPTEKAYDKPGDYGDGHFCGLRCGYSFAVRLADLGRRLEFAR